MDDLLTVKQAAKELDISATQVRRLIHDDRFEGAVLLGHTWIIPRKSVEEYKRTRRDPGRPPKPSIEEEE